MKQKKSNQIKETGRSMIETLGVLAIIGVLSIAGITGYKYAMNRYQTNQIIAELNLLRNQINIAMNRLEKTSYELSLGEPYDNERLNTVNASFSYGCGVDTTISPMCYNDDTVYYQQLDGINQTLCQSIAQSMQFMPQLLEQRINNKIDSMGTNCTEENNKLTFFFKKEDDNIGKENCSQLHPFYNTTKNQCEACPANKPKWNSLEKKCEVCPVDFKWNPAMNRCEGTQEKPCVTNDECPKGEYCLMGYNCQPEKDTFSSCQKPTFLDKKAATNFVVSGTLMSWWSAKNFCHSIGKKSLSYSDLKCADEICDSCINGYCHQNKVENTDYKQDNISQVVQELKKAYPSVFQFWTSRPNSEAYCFAYLFNPTSGEVRTDPKYNKYNAVCQ